MLASSPLKKAVQSFLRIFIPILRKNFAFDRQKQKKKLKENICGFKEFIREYTGLDFWLLAVGLISLAIGVARYQYAQESWHWPQTRGRIISLSISSHQSGGGRDADGGVRASHTSYEPRVAYEYEIDFKRYTSRIRSFGAGTFSNRRNAEAVIARYRIGQEVTVFYNPEKPDIGVIELVEADPCSTFFIIGVAFTGLGFFFLLVGITNRIRKKIFPPPG